MLYDPLQDEANAFKTTFGLALALENLPWTLMPVDLRRGTAILDKNQRVLCYHHDAEKARDMVDWVNGNCHYQ